MKLAVFLFLVGCAIASPIDKIPHDIDVEDLAEGINHDFMVGVGDTEGIKVALGLSENYTEIDVKNEVNKKIEDAMAMVLDKIKFAIDQGKEGRKHEEALTQVLEDMKDSVDQGKVHGDNLHNKLREMRDKLREMRIDRGDKANELMNKLRERVREFIKDLLDKMGVKNGNKRSVEEADISMLDFNLKDLFRKLKKELLETIDKEKVIAMVEKLFGKGSGITKTLEDFINKMGTEYKQKLLDLIDRFLGKVDQLADQQSMGDYWQKVKDYFKDLKIDLQEKYMKFGEWIKKVGKETKDKGKTKIENIKEMANQFLKHTKECKKVVAEQALDFFTTYKEGLGSIYKEVKESVEYILSCPSCD